MKIIMYLFLGLAMFFALDCDNTNDTEVEDKEFLNTIWTLTSFEIDGEKINPPEDQVYTIQFKEDGTFTGQSDCNEIGGKYRIVENNLIEIIQIGTTKIYCGEDSKGNDYTSAISESHSFNINNSKMFLSYGTENSKMIFITI